MAATRDGVEAVLPCAECHAKFASRVFLERVDIDRTVALIAEHLNERWAAFFLRRLYLTVGNAQQVHLQRLDEEIL
jgi:hypothetical protein